MHSSSYVQIHKDNYCTFSDEFASLQCAIGAEMDSFFKVYCGYRSTDETNIADYAGQIFSGRYSAIVDQEVFLREYGITLHPYKNWEISRPKQSLQWWLAYDNVKHSRYENMKDANLENVLNMLGGLCILEMKYLKELADLYNDTDCPDSISKLFILKNWQTRCQTLEGAIIN